MVEEIQTEQQNISKKAVEALWKQEHFNEYPNRCKFREEFEKNYETLLRCV